MSLRRLLFLWLSIICLAAPALAQPLPKLKLRFDPVANPGAGTYLKLCIEVPGYNPAKPRTWRTVHHDGSWQGAGDITLRYGNPGAMFTFDLVQPRPGVVGIPEDLARSFADGCQTYLVRISSQYAWSSQAISSISLASSVPVIVESASLLAGWRLYLVILATASPCAPARCRCPST